MDYKSLLQESVQTVKKSVTYNLVEESGPAHHKTFKSEVIIDGLVYGEGVGFTKKEAEQNAAFDAYKKSLKKFGLEYNEDWILHGDFTPGCAEQVILDKFKSKEDIQFDASIRSDGKSVVDSCIINIKP